MTLNSHFFCGGGASLLGREKKNSSRFEEPFKKTNFAGSLSKMSHKGNCLENLNGEGGGAGVAGRNSSAKTIIR